MNAQLDGAEDLQRRHFEAALADCIGTIFRRAPMLNGFSVDDEMCVSNMGCFPTLLEEDSSGLREQVAAALSELLDETPDAAEFMRGRTFARALH